MGILEDYGWTYDEYLDAPEWVTEAIMARRMVRNKLEEKAYEKAQRSM